MYEFVNPGLQTLWHLPLVFRASRWAGWSWTCMN